MTNQFLIFGAAALLLLGAGCAVTDEPDEIPKAEVDPELYEKAALLAGTIDFLSRNYADPDRATENKLYDAALRGMVRELDPYSGYEPPPEFQVNQEERSGEYAGIGVVTVKRSDHPLQIVGVLPDSPAAAAGIKPGEGILRIGNERTASLSLEDCSARIRGPAGSELQLELTGPEGCPTRMVTLKRAIVVRPSVPKESARIIGDGVGYLRIENFNAHTPAEFRDRLETLRKAGIKIGSTTAYTEDIMDLVTEEAKSRGVWVDEWFCPECSGEKGRPYPYMIFKNMQFLGISGVDRVIKVGNTPADIQEGKRAGVLTVGILEGSLAMGMTADDFEDLSGEAYEKECARTRQIFCEAGADYVIANLKELPELIRRLEAGDEEKISA